MNETWISRSMKPSRTELWTAGWSRRRRVAIAAFGLFMLYVHSLYFTGFYIPEEEYWFPFWTGMTVGDRLLSLALAAVANIGLIATPFLRSPGRTLRFLLVGSLVSGALVSLAWLVQSLVGWVEGAIQYPQFLVKTLLYQVPSTVIYYTVFGCHIYLCVRSSYDLLALRKRVRRS
jgi:hypothetical protein